MDDSKDHHKCQPPGMELKQFYPTISQYWSHQGRHNTVMHWIEQYFSHIEKKQSKISSYSMLWSLMASGCPWKPMQGSWLICTSIMPQQKDFSPTTMESEILKARVMPLGYRWTHLRRTKNQTQSQKQEKIIPHKAISLAQAALALYLLRGTCSRPKAHSNLAELGSEDCAHETAFPSTTFYTFQTCFIFVL